jgi:hypothetical protein
MDNERENSHSLPYSDPWPDGTTTSRLRIGGTLLRHDVAFFSTSTTKGIWNLCQAKTGEFREILRGEEHIFRLVAGAAAFFRVQVPICGAKVIARRESEGPGSAIDRLRYTLQFEKHSYGRFIQVQMKTRLREAGAIFFISEPGTQAKGPKNCVQPTG